MEFLQESFPDVEIAVAHGKVFTTFNCIVIKSKGSHVSFIYLVHTVIILVMKMCDCLALPPPEFNCLG